jgi:hypothetical protein
MTAGHWPFICSFYPQTHTNTNKKSSLFLRQAAFLRKSNGFFYSKLPLACQICTHRPPPANGIFTVNLLHSMNIKSNLPSFVKKKRRNFWDVQGTFLTGLTKDCVSLSMLGQWSSTYFEAMS